MIAVSGRDLVVAGQGRPRVSAPRIDLLPGEVVALYGPNGAGKTSLLRCLGLIQKPDSGQVLFDGQPINWRDTLGPRRRIGVVFQAPIVLRGSVLDNVATPLKFAGVADREARDASRVWLERLGIGPLAARPADRVSGGELRRLALARALVTGPGLLLLDEPFASIDEPTRYRLLRDLKELLAEQRPTTLLVTHSRLEVEALADRVVVIVDGAVRQQGRLAEVTADPVDAAVAAFVRATIE